SVNGQADLSLRAARGTLDEALYTRVAAHTQVALASPVVELNTQALRRDGQRLPLRVVGLDVLVSAPLGPAMVPQLAEGQDRLAIFAPDAISLNATAQRTLGLKPGDTVTVQAGLKPVTLQVIGSVAAGGEAL